MRRPMVAAKVASGATLASALSVPLALITVGRLHDAFSRFTGSIPAAKVLIPLCYLALVLLPLAVIAPPRLRTPQSKGFIALVAAMAISLPFSYYKSSSLTIFIDFITKSVPIFFVMLFGIRNLADLERLFRAGVLMLIVMGLIILAGFGVVYYGPDGARTTLSGSYDPNDLALVVASCSAFSMWALRDRLKLWRLLGLVSLCLSAYVITRTYSRGGSLAFGGMIVLAVIFSRKSLPIWFRLALIPAVAGALLLAPADFRDRLSTLGSVSEDYNTFAPAGRIEIWKRGVGYFLARPLNGVGIGQFVFAEGKWGAERGYVQGWEWKAAHNMYVESSAELGIVGITGILAMFVPTIIWSRRIMKRRAETEEQIRIQRAGETLLLAVSAFLMGAMFLSAVMHPIVLWLTAMGAAYRAMTDGPIRAPAPGPVRQRVPANRWRPAAGATAASVQSASASPGARAPHLGVELR